MMNLMILIPEEQQLVGSFFIQMAKTPPLRFSPFHVLPVPCLDNNPYYSVVIAFCLGTHIYPGTQA